MQNYIVGEHDMWRNSINNLPFRFT